MVDKNLLKSYDFNSCTASSNPPLQDNEGLVRNKEPQKKMFVKVGGVVYSRLLPTADAAEGMKKTFEKHGITFV
jgi:hypothetical protein